MKTLGFILIFYIVPFNLQSQRVVVLSLQQPPELRYEAVTREYSIIKGGNVTLGSDLLVTGGSGSYSYNWIPGAGLNDSTLKNPVASPAATTTYLLKVTDKNGCTLTLDYKVTVTPSTPVPYISSGIGPELSAVIYPNPGNGNFLIRLRGKPSREIHLLIADGLGRTLCFRKYDHFPGELDETIRTGLPSGIYSLIIRSEGGGIQRRLTIYR